MEKRNRNFGVSDLRLLEFGRCPVLIAPWLRLSQLHIQGRNGFLPKVSREATQMDRELRCPHPLMTNAHGYVYQIFIILIIYANKQYTPRKEPRDFHFNCDLDSIHNDKILGTVKTYRVRGIDLAGNSCTRWDEREFHLGGRPIRSHIDAGAPLNRRAESMG